MESGVRPIRRVSLRPNYEAIRLIAVILAVAGGSPAQPVPASITTIDQPTSGPAVFDAAGNVYYLGGPVTPGAAQTQPGGGTCFFATGFIGSIPGPCSDAHIVKVDPAGNVVWGTLLGGETADSASALALDPAGNVFVTGSTGGSFPTTSGAAAPTSSTAKAFAAKVSADGKTILYSTYLPDTAATARAIGLDGQGNAYITGQSASHQSYVLKVSADGSTILYQFYFESSGPGSGTALRVDAAGNVLVAGWTSASDFPVTAGALQTALAGVQNLFIAKLDPVGRVVFSTYLGGSGTDTPSALQTDSAGDTYVAGVTSSLDFPTTPGTFQPAPIVPAWNNFSPAGFAAKLNPSGTGLKWSTFVMSADGGLQLGVGAMAVTASGDVYLGGVTGAGFPVTPSAPQICFNGLSSRTNGFVAHLSPEGALIDATYLGANVRNDVNFVWGLSVADDSSVQVVWHYAGNNVLSRFQFGTGGWTAPACLSGSVLNAATQSANNGVAAGELITLTGFRIGPEAGVAYVPDAQGQIPRQLAGVQVLIDGLPVPVLYAQSRQINAITPLDIAGKSATSIVVLYNGQQFGPVSVSVSFGSPGIFRLRPGTSNQAVALNEDSTLNGPSNPAARGSVVTIWATGYGPTNPACVPGGLNVPQATGLGPGITAQLFDGRIYNALYAGSAPKLVCGVVQVNMKVPDTGGPGTYLFAPWILLVEGNSTTSYQPPIGAAIEVK
jgi:uncharacterized protein (TIGR03437 family)